MRQPFMSGNWKMNLDRESIKSLCASIKEHTSGLSQVEVGLFPPYPYLAEVVNFFQENANVLVGGQDLYFEKKGAYTSMVSGDMLKDIGATHVLVGHSERREIFGDTDEICNKKVGAALEAGLIPVLCVGELLPEREAGKTADVVLRQVGEGLKGYSAEDLKDLIIAYEPVWAIGTGKTATPEQADESHKIIRNWFQSAYSQGFADQIRILYGGSVTPDNVDTLMATPDVDGALVGGASLKPESFSRIMTFRS